MKAGFSIDLVLLSKFQKLSDWVQDHVGYNNFAIARGLRVAMIIALAVREVLSFLKGIDPAELVVIASSVMVMFKISSMSYRAQQSLKNNPEFKNPVVSEFAVTRVLIQFVGIAAFGFLLNHLYHIINPSVNYGEQFDQCKEFFWDLFGTLMFFATYFSSCTPKPYKPSKARKLIEKAGQMVSLGKPALSYS
jgi:hypothetical protein